MIVAVGGHSRNIGKTAVMCGIIAGLQEFQWTAIKITQYGHGVCSKNGEPCDCADPRCPIAVSEEAVPNAGTDSGRYLLAGAARSFWVRTPMGRLAEAMPQVLDIAAGAQNLIVESNSLLSFMRPDRYVMVVDGAVADFKASSRRFLDRADALVPTSAAPLRWPDIPEGLVQTKRTIPALAPDYTSKRLIDWIAT